MKRPSLEMKQTAPGPPSQRALVAALIRVLQLLWLLSPTVPWRAGAQNLQAAGQKWNQGTWRASRQDVRSPGPL